MELKYTFRSLAKLEEMTGKTIDLVLKDRSLNIVTALVAVGLDISMDEAFDIMDDQIKSGRGVIQISQDIATGLKESGFMGKPLAPKEQKHKSLKK